ncbi:TM0106 family RecB-like putative nuclease [Candidatus Poribacteria bacterium]|nr:TM0106 family RecB-like putative nuclease [Candidatus Poribacteria bacterium]MYC40144.1 TM0106 family RecB-like putative nuclease [Candidatus Dadabacteria bacterium]
MKKTGSKFDLTASDLVGYLNCRYLSTLDRAVAEGVLAKPTVWDPLLQVLLKRGSIHEQNYVAHLEQSGLGIVRIDGSYVTEEAVEETLLAMRQGVAVIVQGALSCDGWGGRADILRRVEKPGIIGDWSYEAIDTKLARETRAGTILQLCLYSDLLTKAQGVTPDYMYVVVPWSDFEPRKYRFADYAAYFRKVQRALREFLISQEAEKTYPDPKEYCDICRWRENCDKHRRDDDHLCLVAGISKLQIKELSQHNITTVQDLALLPLPPPWEPERGSANFYDRVREQARIQVEARESGKCKFELLPVKHGFGLSCLPEPSPGDIFFDLEGDPFVGEHGLEYLFGYVFNDESADTVYKNIWAFSRAEERQTFENFVDFVMERWEQYPDLHIYHYAPYETSALKRLMGRYASREEEIDQLLRAGVFIDLYQVVRHSIRASVESYSIKDLEPFYGFKRNTQLPDANAALANLQANLELDDIPSITEETKATVLVYNKDDCASVAGLRDWLETQRGQLLADGADIPRPEPGDGSPTERITDWLMKINPLIEQLTAGIPTDPEKRDKEQQGLWVLANIIDWHRREDKAVWWEYFRLCDLSAEELMDERTGLSGLTFVNEVGGTERAPIHRYKFPPQENEFRGGENLCNCEDNKIVAKVAAISFEDYTIDIKKRQDSKATHPHAVFAHDHVSTQVLADSLVRLAEHVVSDGLRGEGKYRAARDLLLKETPRIGGQKLHREGEATVDAAVRLCGHLEGGILAIQGPPGTGKTFTGAQMICELVHQGKTVGITANSHKVIRNLIDAAIAAAEESGVDLRCCHKAAEIEDEQPRLCFTRKNEELFDMLGSSVNVGGGTAWLWARPEASEIIDVLFVDEAAQMSLANVLAVSQAANTVVLIGDPQQLDQPMQGSHPDGTNVSALDHVLAGKQTIRPEQGLFLEETWRLHPDICNYTSELFYEGKLKAKKDLKQQVVHASGPINGAGLYYLPVEHEGNQNCSPEEALAIEALVKRLLNSDATWVDRDGSKRPVTLDNILIITPYNAQVFEIQRLLAGARVGTVDKFQGQEAPIAIYSTATSSHKDAPRGMEFLYSLNRLNVATSRAKCLSIMVSSPQVFEAECRTPRQIQLANAFCRYLELAEEIKLVP